MGGASGSTLAAVFASEVVSPSNSDGSSDISSIRTTSSFDSSETASTHSLRNRSRSSSLGDLLSSATEKTVYSNDYGLAISETSALSLSKYPPKNAYRMAPQRHYDSDPFYVPPALQEDPHALRHAEFGYSSEPFEYTSQFRQSTGVGGEEIEEPSLIVYLTTYVSYLILIVVGHIRDFVGKRTHRKSYQHLMPYNVSPLLSHIHLHAYRST